MDEPQPADVERLLAERQALAAHILVRVGNRAGELGQRDAVALEPVGIDVDVDLSRVAAKSDHVHDTGYLPELPLQDPVLRRLQLRERVAGTAQHVTVDLANGAPRRELWLDAVR